MYTKYTSFRECFILLLREVKDMFKELSSKGETFLSAVKNNKELDSLEFKEWVSESVIIIEETLKDSSLVEKARKANEDFNDHSVEKIENILAILIAADKSSKNDSENEEAKSIDIDIKL